MNYFENALKTLKEWVKIESVKSSALENMPFGYNINEMVKKCVADASALGFNVINYDGYAVEVNYGEGSDEEGLSVLCHLDVVPEGDRALWETEPFTLTEKDGYLIGRGVVDDKGPAVLCLYALKELKDKVSRKLLVE